MQHVRIILAGFVLCLAGCRPAENQLTSGVAAVESHPRNVILFIADGCGPASLTMARQFVRWQGGGNLALDEMLVGAVQTNPANGFITDSAASATAYACGVKTHNGAIAVDTAGRPVATLLEAAESLGMSTGLVATSTITHATPASFSAHVLNRAHQDSVALQQISRGIDVILGGGANYYLPMSSGGLRMDARDLIEEARGAGYAIARSRKDLAQISEPPVLGLFAGGHMSYEIDRDTDVQPSLAEMTRYAIQILAADPDGFFLMVEGSRIDHAAHSNDVPTHLHDILAFDEAVSHALDFARSNGETLVVSTSDHETGGLSVGARVDEVSYYTWHPEIIQRATHSLEYAMDSLRGRTEWPRLLSAVGINDPTPQELEDGQGSTWSRQTLADMQIRRLRIGWTTGGHTAVDVPIFAFGPGSKLFGGHLDNTEVGVKLAQLMRVDLGELTEQLRMQGF